MRLPTAPFVIVGVTVKVRTSCRHSNIPPPPHMRAHEQSEAIRTSWVKTKSCVEIRIPSSYLHDSLVPI